MTKKPIKNSPWIHELCISLINGANTSQRLDFNRFRYLGVPKTQDIQQCALRPERSKDYAMKMFLAITTREDAGQSTKVNIFSSARNHFQFCDNHNPRLLPLTAESFLKELQHNTARQRLGEIKDSTETRKRGDLKTFFEWMGVSTKPFFPTKNLSRISQQEPTRGYSQTELRKLLPLLRSIFKQLYHQFILDPQMHLSAKSITPTMTFCWQGKCYPVATGVNKIFYVAAYLLSYYTWGNSTVLYNLKRPQSGSHSFSETWYQMPAFKRRAFKTISVEIGDNSQVHIPKYAMQFFDQLLKASKEVDQRPDGLLLPNFRFRIKTIQPMSACLLADFNNKWLGRYFPMMDDYGKRLTPVPRRFRATGSHLTIANKGPIEAALLLDNTPNVVAKNYSSGNQHLNNQMNRDTSWTLEQQVRDKSSIEAAKQKVRDMQKVDVLAYEAYLRKSAPPLRNANGSYCKEQNGEKSELFTARAKSHDLLNSSEKIACADLLGCWDCKHQVLVDSVVDIWCILSFRECLEESTYLHLDSKHFKNNFEHAISKIDARIKQFSIANVRKARRKLNDDGRHPLWLDAALIDF
ncbi:hypothetical protein EGC76_10990 [Pseudidiomarina gelatinasegens]|uniref:Core-binding (CB) domain-containing protein n=1 Tax=Pseudidiomarina gelatinasegens TaxID=2487740 RepID=A0A443YY04_9GAMM|nr:hypothetical protein [Pseudidiomarina gelatinasegens]RWU08864.1 hypothetical protein EGC76_10990 [Pseudidiomarina gelatinasegens]